VHTPNDSPYRCLNTVRHRLREIAAVPDRSHRRRRRRRRERDGQLELVFCGGFRKSVVMEWSQSAGYHIAYESDDAGRWFNLALLATWMTTASPTSSMRLARATGSSVVATEAISRPRLVETKRPGSRHSVARTSVIRTRREREFIHAVSISVDHGTGKTRTTQTQFHYLLRECDGPAASRSPRLDDDSSEQRRANVHHRRP